MTISKSSEAVKQSEGLWIPSNLIEEEPLDQVALAVAGPSGVGKTWLQHQCAKDPEFAGNIISIMTERGISSIGRDLVASGAIKVYRLQWSNKIDSSPLRRLIDTLEEAAREIKTRKGVLFLDSVSGLSDQQTLHYKHHPIMTKGKPGEPPSRNVLGEYLDMGLLTKEVQILLRNEIPWDVVMLCTTTPPPFPELCVDGKMVPSNFQRLTDVSLFMYADAIKKDPADRELIEAAKTPPPHVSFGRKYDGSLDGTVIRRYFTTQNTGEVPAKGHSNLFITEKADLPNVLRKLHGEGVKEWWK